MVLIIWPCGDSVVGAEGGPYLFEVLCSFFGENTEIFDIGVVMSRGRDRPKDRPNV